MVKVQQRKLNLHGIRKKWRNREIERQKNEQDRSLQVEIVSFMRSTEVCRETQVFNPCGTTMQVYEKTVFASWSN